MEVENAVMIGTVSANRHDYNVIAMKNDGEKSLELRSE